MIKVPVGYSEEKYAEKRPNFFFYVFSSLCAVHMCTPAHPIHKIRCTVVYGIEELEKEPNLYYGWISAETGKLDMIFPKLVHFMVCFTYGYEIEEQRDKGRAVRVRIDDLGEIEH